MSGKRSPRYSDGTEVKERHKLLARLVASVIVAFFRLSYAVLKAVFSLLSVLAANI